MSLNNLDIGAALFNNAVSTKRQINDEVFNLKMRVKRKLDAGLSKAEAQEAMDVLAALEAIEEGLNQE